MTLYTSYVSWKMFIPPLPAHQVRKSNIFPQILSLEIIIHFSRDGVLAGA